FIAIAICIPTITICRWGGRVLLATDARDNAKFGDYLGFTLIGSMIGMAVVAGMVFVRPPLNAEQGPNLYLIGLVMIVSLWNSLESISDIFTALFQRHERMDFIAKS